MKKIVPLMILFILIGCAKDDMEHNDIGNENKQFNQKIWDVINEQEYSADNGWAGEGMYFYEEEGIYYCTHLIYGSGVRVAGHFTTEIWVNNDNEIILSLYNHETGEPEEVAMEYDFDTNTITFGSLLFEDRDVDFYEYR